MLQVAQLSILAKSLRPRLQVSPLLIIPLKSELKLRFSFKHHPQRPLKPLTYLGLVSPMTSVQMLLQVNPRSGVLPSGLHYDAISQHKQLGVREDEDSVWGLSAGVQMDSSHNSPKYSLVPLLLCGQGLKRALHDCLRQVGSLQERYGLG